MINRTLAKIFEKAKSYIRILHLEINDYGDKEKEFSTDIQNHSAILSKTVRFYVNEIYDAEDIIKFKEELNEFILETTNPEKKINFLVTNLNNRIEKEFNQLVIDYFDTTAKDENTYSFFNLDKSKDVYLKVKEMPYGFLFYTYHNKYLKLIRLLNKVIQSSIDLYDLYIDVDFYNSNDDYGFSNSDDDYGFSNNVTIDSINGIYRKNDFVPENNDEIIEEYKNYIIKLGRDNVFFNDKSKIQKQDKKFSVLEWATIFFYANETKLLPENKTIINGKRQFIKTHDIETTLKYFNKKYGEAKNRINKKMDYPIDKLEKIIPFLKKHYNLTVLKVKNDIEFLENNKPERQ